MRSSYLPRTRSRRNSGALTRPPPAPPTACPDCVGTHQEAPDLGGLPVTWHIDGWVTRDARGLDVEVFEPFYVATSALPTSLPDPDVRKRLLEYDALGRVLRDTDPGLDTTVTAYQRFETVVSTPELADVITRSDGQGRTTWTRQDIGGQERTILASYNPLGAIEQLTVQARDPGSGDLTSVVQQYGHDSWGQLSYLSSPDAGRKQYFYNDFGQLVDVYNGECDQLSFAYDDAGRLTEQQLHGVSRADGSVVDPVTYQFVYDAPTTGALLAQVNLRSRLATVLEDGNDRVDVTYDDLGRQSAWARHVQGEEYDEQVELSMSGRVLRTISSTMSLSLSRQYDSLSRPTSVEGFWQANELDAAGRVVDETYVNGVTQSYGYDVKGLPSSIHAQRPMGPGVLETFFHQTATRKAFGPVATITDLVHDGSAPLDGFSHDAVLEYDAGGRLTSSTLGPAASPVGVAIAYDGLDNIIERTTTGVGDIGILTGTYQYGTATDGPRQLRSTTLPSGDPGATFGHDLAGRIVHEDNKKRVFDALDNLREVELGATSTPGNGTVSYAYGYDRLRKTATYPDGQVDLWFSESVLLRNNELQAYVSAGGRVVGKLTVDRAELAAALASASVEATRATHLGAKKAAVALLLVLVGLLLALSRRQMRGLSRPWVRATASVMLLTFGASACGMTSGQGSTVQDFTRGALALETGIRQFFHPGFRPGPAVITTEADVDGKVAVFEERRVSPFGMPIDALREEIPGQPTVASSDFFGREAFGALEKQHDHTTGHTHHVARWMAPQVGRWLSPDPLFLQLPEKAVESPFEANLYSYAANDPISLVDPSGENPFLWLFFGRSGGTRGGTQIAGAISRPIKGAATSAEGVIGAFAKDTSLEFVQQGKADVAVGSYSNTLVKGESGYSNTHDLKLGLFGGEQMLAPKGNILAGRTGVNYRLVLVGTGLKFAAGLEYDIGGNGIDVRGFLYGQGQLADTSLRLKINTDLELTSRFRRLTPLSPVKGGVQTTSKLDLSPEARRQSLANLEDLLSYTAELLSL